MIIKKTLLLVVVVFLFIHLFYQLVSICQDLLNIYYALSIILSTKDISIYFLKNTKKQKKQNLCLPGAYVLDADSNTEAFYVLHI